MTRSRKSRFRFADVVTVVGLLAVAVLPLVAGVVDVETWAYEKAGRAISLDENRTLASFPKVPLTLDEYRNFPVRFDRYWDDHFGFRYTTIRGKKWLYRSLFNASDSDRVLVGKDGWLFLKSQDNVEKYVQHVYPYSDKELNERASAFVRLARDFRERNIRYVMVIAPNKHTVYPEYLPDYLVASERTRCDQLVDRINELAPGEVEIVDLRPFLRAAKGEELLYEKMGSHWNGLGAFAGYVAVARHLGLVPLARNRFDQSVESKVFDLSKATMSAAVESVPILEPDNDLADMIGSTEKVWLWPEGKQGDENDAEARRVPFETRAAMPTDSREIVIFRDSFCTRLVDLLAVHFGQATFVWQEHVEEKYISPSTTVVVHEFVERKLMNSTEFHPGGSIGKRESVQMEEKTK